MNSKYAPIVALTVLAIIIVGALGWFLAIKPRVSSAAEYSHQSQEVDQNTSQLQLETTTLAQYEQQIEEMTPLDDSIALNLPSVVDMAVYRDRITTAVASSQVALISLKLEGSYPVDGWQMPPSSRASYSIARLFATGPVHTPSGTSTVAPAEGATPTPGDATAPAGVYTPPVSPSNETGPVVTGLNGLPVTISVTGTYAQNVAFLKALTGNPAEQMFLIYDVTQTQRNKSSSPITGVPNAKDGDVITTVTGVFYFLDPETSVTDDSTPAPVSPSGTSPFAPSAGNKPSSK